jgi:hypothetical protein
MFLLFTWNLKMDFIADECTDSAGWCSKIGHKVALSRCYRHHRRCCASCRRLALSIPGENHINNHKLANPRHKWDLRCFTFHNIILISYSQQAYIYLTLYMYIIYIDNGSLFQNVRSETRNSTHVRLSVLIGRYLTAMPTTKHVAKRATCSTVDDKVFDQL